MSTSELLAGPSELTKRVDDLRALYRSHRDQLGDGFSALRSRGVLGLGAGKADDALHAPATRSQDDSSSDEDEKRAKRVAMAAALRAKYFMDNVDAFQLQTVVRQILAEHGGSAHLDTIVEYVRMRWPNLRRRDGSHYSLGDFRKLTLTCLRTHRRTLFAPDRFHENCFALFHGGGDTPADGPASPAGDEAHDLEDEAGDARDTLANALVRHLEAKGAVWSAAPNAAPQPAHAPGLLADELSAAVGAAWAGHSALDADELREAIRLTIATNPRLRKDPRRPDALLAAPRRARAQPVEAAAAAAGGNGTARGEWKRRRGKADEGDEEGSNAEASDDDAPRARNARRGGRGASAAGALSGKGGGAVGKRREAAAAAAAAASGREKDKEEKNPWIQCDGCHRWVQARSDNIEDISLYDDANPDHLDYFCPRCRKKRATDANAPGAAADDASDAAPRAPRNKGKRARGGAEEGVAEEEAAPTRRSTRAKGGRKRTTDDDEEEEEGEEEEDGEGEGKLEAMERTLLDEWEEEKGARAAQLEGEAERAAAVRALEKKFEEEAAKYKATLVTHRNAAWERNARDADAADVELLDDKAEEELAGQFRDWFERRRAKLRAHIDETLHDA